MRKEGIVITGLLTPSDAAEIAGVSRATLRRWALKGDISTCAVGGRLFYDLNEIKSALEEHARGRKDS